MYDRALPDFFKRDQRNVSAFTSKFDNLKCILSLNVFQIIIEYALLDWYILLDAEPKIIASVLQNEPELYSMMQGLKHIIQLEQTLNLRNNELQHRIDVIANRKSKTTGIIISVLLLTADAFTIFECRILSQAMDDLNNLAKASQGLIAENCLKGELLKNRGNLCRWDYKGLVSEFGCETSIDPTTLFGLCSRRDELNVRFVVCVMAATMLLIISVCVIFINYKCFFTKNIGSLSATLLDKPFQEKISTYLNRTDLNGLNLIKVKDVLELPFRTLEQIIFN